MPPDRKATSTMRNCAGSPNGTSCRGVPFPFVELWFMTGSLLISDMLIHCSVLLLLPIFLAGPHNALQGCNQCWAACAKFCVVTESQVTQSSFSFER